MEIDLAEFISRNNLEETVITQYLKRRSRKKKIKSWIFECISYGDHVGTSGISLDYYIDCRPLIANSNTKLTIIKALYDLLGDKFNIVFGGPLTSGSILASEMALFRQTHSIIFNTKANNIIYPFRANNVKARKIVLVDDVITTGKTIKDCFSLTDMKFDCILCIVNRSNFEDIEGVPIFSLFTKRDFNLG